MYCSRISIYSNKKGIACGLIQLTPFWKFDQQLGKWERKEFHTVHMVCTRLIDSIIIANEHQSLQIECCSSIQHQHLKEMKRSKFDYENVPVKSVIRLNFGVLWNPFAARKLR